MALKLPSNRRVFEVGIICALPIEAYYVKAIFSEIDDEDNWSDKNDARGRRAVGNRNAYTTGKVGRHDVVLVHMPSIGKVSAAGVAASLTYSFEGLRLVILAGISSGSPLGTKENEIVLGDIVLGKTVIQYDLGRQYPDGFKRKSNPDESLGRQNPEIRAFVNKLEAGKDELEESTFECLMALTDKLGHQKIQYPGVLEDKLFESDYDHKHQIGDDCEERLCSKGNQICQISQQSSCEQVKCSDQYLVPRHRLSKIGDAAQAGRDAQATKPIIHFGAIASGDKVMKSARDRDMITEKEGVIAFEMEGAGVWEYLPCIIVKGVCDYADSHKNKIWQGYAAAAAAACTEAILKKWPKADRQYQEDQGYVVFNNYNSKIVNQAYEQTIENQTVNL